MTLEFVTSSNPYIPSTSTSGSNSNSSSGGTASTKRKSNFNFIITRLKNHFQQHFTRRSKNTHIMNNYRYVRVIYNDQPQIVEVCRYAYSLQKNLTEVQLKSDIYLYWCPYEIFLEILKIYMISHRDYEKGCSVKKKHRKL